MSSRSIREASIRFCKVRTSCNYTEAQQESPAVGLLLAGFVGAQEVSSAGLPRLVCCSEGHNKAVKTRAPRTHGQARPPPPPPPPPACRPPPSLTSPVCTGLTARGRHVERPAHARGPGGRRFRPPQVHRRRRARPGAAVCVPAEGWEAPRALSGWLAGTLLHVERTHACPPSSSDAGNKNPDPERWRGKQVGAGRTAPDSWWPVAWRSEGLDCRLCRTSCITYAPFGHVRRWAPPPPRPATCLRTTLTRSCARCARWAALEGGRAGGPQHSRSPATQLSLAAEWPCPCAHPLPPAGRPVQAGAALPRAAARQAAQGARLAGLPCAPWQQQCPGACQPPPPLPMPTVVCACDSAPLPTCFAPPRPAHS